MAGLKQGLGEVPIIYWLYFGVRRGIYALWRGYFTRKTGQFLGLSPCRVRGKGLFCEGFTIMIFIFRTLLKIAQRYLLVPLVRFQGHFY